MEKRQTIEAALDIVRANVYTVEACTNDDAGTVPTPEQVSAFEARAKAVIGQATPEQLEKVYNQVLMSADPSEPISPATLLCWLGDSASEIPGLRVYSINLEADR